MKKIFPIILAVLMISMIPKAALAETASSVFSIDDKNVYKGMDKAYRYGYVPLISGNKTTIILPLVASIKMESAKIAVMPNLGDPSSAPFIFKNYHKTVSLKQNSVNNGKSTVESYYVKLDLELSENRQNGSYPVTIDVKATDMNGNQIRQTFITYVVITDAEVSSNTEVPINNNTLEDSLGNTDESINNNTLEDATAASSSINEFPISTDVPETNNASDDSTKTDNTGESKPTSEPIVIVSGSSINPNPVKVGEEFTAKVTLLNTNHKKPVQNMTVTVTTEEAGLTLLNDSNVLYFENLAAGKTLEFELKYKTGMETPTGKYDISLAIAYDNSDATTLSSANIIMITVEQPLKVELGLPQIPSEVNAGDTLPLAFQIINLGRSNIYNARCEINVPGLVPAGSAFVGNMEPGTAMDAQTNIFIGAKNMSDGYEGNDKYGLTAGVVKLIYEDAGGNEYVEEFEISTNIKEPTITTSSDIEKEEPKRFLQWWISFAALGLAILIGAFYFILRKKRGGQSYEAL